MSPRDYALILIPVFFTIRWAGAMKTRFGMSLRDAGRGCGEGRFDS